MDLATVEIEPQLNIFGRDPRILDLRLTVLHFDKTIEHGLTHRPSCGNTDPGVTGDPYSIIEQGEHRSVGVAFESHINGSGVS